MTERGEKESVEDGIKALRYETANTWKRKKTLASCLNYTEHTVCMETHRAEVTGLSQTLCLAG